MNIMHVIITLALAIVCTTLYRERLRQADFVEACEMDHVTTRRELEEALSELSRYKSLQNTFRTDAVVAPPLKCPECPTAPVRAKAYTPGRRQPLSTGQLSTDGVDAIKKLILERDELEKKLKRAHLKPSPVVSRVLDKYRRSDHVMKETIQVMSSELLELKYGPGPYYVELILGFADTALEPQRVLIELAAKDAPYTTLYYLAQLQRDLWTGCNVNLNPGHVLLADPSIPSRSVSRYQDMLTTTCDRIKFNSNPYADAEGRVVFQEYSNNRPHVPFTLGLSGR